jgi:hypothetical protein
MDREKATGNSQQRRIKRRTRDNIEETIIVFRAKFPASKVLHISFPAAVSKGIDGDGVKEITRTVQRVLTSEFGAFGYRLIEFSKGKNSGECDIPHLHIVVNHLSDPDACRLRLYEALGWRLPRPEESSHAELVVIKNANVRTGRYLAKSLDYQAKACVVIPARFASIKRVFDGFGWRRDPGKPGKMLARPRKRKNVPFGKGSKWFPEDGTGKPPM